MIVQLNPSALRETHWYEYLIRFALGGAVTVVAGVIAARFGPVVGGLFLAFPAIFPASATLIEKHVRRRKEKAGLSGVRRGRKRLRWMPRAPHSEAWALRRSLSLSGSWSSGRLLGLSSLRPWHGSRLRCLPGSYGDGSEGKIVSSCPWAMHCCLFP